MKHIPNFITLARIACVPLFVAFMMRQDFHAAFVLIALMGISDALDGFLAKQFNWQSKFGAYLDPLADKLIIITAFVLLLQFNLLPLWLVSIVIARDILIVIGCVSFRYLWSETEFSPHWTGKVSTFMQFILIVSVLAAQLIALPEFVVPLLINCTAVAAVISVTVYVSIGRSMRTNAKREYKKCL